MQPNIMTTLPQFLDSLDGVERALIAAIAWLAVISIILVAEIGRRK